MARRLEPLCASLYVEPLPSGRTKAALRFVLGGSFSASLYRSRAMKGHVRDLMRRARPSVTVAYSSVMARYAVDGLPLVLDMRRVGDAASAGPRFARGIDARRLRRHEAWYATRARRTLVASTGEAEILQRIAPRCSSAVMENGVDFHRFDPERIVPPPSLAGRRFVLLARADSTERTLEEARWIVERVLPEISRRGYPIELASPVQDPRGPRRLPDVPGVLPPAADADTLAYLAAARAVIAPGSRRRASSRPSWKRWRWANWCWPPALFAAGLVPTVRAACAGVMSRLNTPTRCCSGAPTPLSATRTSASTRRRFSWDTNLEVLEREVQVALRSVNPFMFAAVS